MSVVLIPQMLTAADFDPFGHVIEGVSRPASMNDARFRRFNALARYTRLDEHPLTPES